MPRYRREFLGETVLSSARSNKLHRNKNKIQKCEKVSRMRTWTRHTVHVSIETPMNPPLWALLERELLKQQTLAVKEFYNKYFDERGYLLCVPRWGGDDGPDDAAENMLNWTRPRRPRCPSPATACTTKSSQLCLTGSTTARVSQPSSCKDFLIPMIPSYASACNDMPAST